MGDLAEKDLWSFITNACKAKVTPDEAIYRRKGESKLYLQVKVSHTSNSEQLLVVCTDITSVKAIESQGKKMRASFFSSVAHELRTPLNSILPLLKIVIH